MNKISHYILSISILIAFQIKAVITISTTTNITEEFCKVTETPDTICEKFQAYKRVFYDRIQIDLIEKNTHNDIGYVSFQKDNNNNMQIKSLEIEPKFQENKHGSRLLRYTLAQCTGACTKTLLKAYPSAASTENHDRELERLIKFYERHGGKMLDRDQEAAHFEFKNQGQKNHA